MRLTNPSKRPFILTGKYTMRADTAKILQDDPYLKEYMPVISSRIQSLESLLATIDRDFGGLDSFTKSYHQMGFQITDKCVNYTEWAPGAQAASLVGDFSTVI